MDLKLTLSMLKSLWGNVMTDKELLELAAKAAGLTVEYTKPSVISDKVFQLFFIGNYQVDWRPLEDDGDALRLAVKLKMTVDTNWWNYDQCEFSDTTFVCTAKRFEERHKGDPYAATRRAIVRAAAEIGKTINEEANEASN